MLYNFISVLVQIWIQPEVPKVLIPMFNNLRDVYIHNVFAECDLNWTLFILQAAPSLKNFYVSLLVKFFYATP
jgi:hypothetical protein